MSSFFRDVFDAETGLSSSEVVTRPVAGDTPMDAPPKLHLTEQTLSSYALGTLDDREQESEWPSLAD